MQSRFESSRSSYPLDWFSVCTILLAGLLLGPRLSAQCAPGWSQSLGSGMDGSVRALLTLPNGDLMAGGDFTTAGGVPANRIARWDGTSWSPLGSGIGGSVHALTVLPNGDLIAGGYFATAGGASANNIARWNGSAWSPLGAGVGQSNVFSRTPGVLALSALPNGDVVAGGTFTTAGGAWVGGLSLAAWNGTTWSPMVAASSTLSVYSLAKAANGDLVRGGEFFAFGPTPNITRWSATATVDLGTAYGNVGALAILPNGDLVVGGSFSGMSQPGYVSSNYLARWDGTSWSSLGSGVNGIVSALAALPNGDLVAAGSFTYAGGAANRIARFHGTSWSPLGPGTDGTVRALAVLANGDLAVGGDFLNAGGAGASRLACYRFCSSSYTGAGPGCPGALGVPGNHATSLPRIGATMAVDITNLPQNVGFFTIGWSNTAWSGGALPFDLGAFGAPGCMWRVSDTVTMLLLGTNHVASYSLTIPNHSSFLSAQLYTQCVVLDPLANALRAVVSNAAVATVGP